MRKMKREETVAEKYLIGLSRGVVQFEPDGNIPPDFRVASTIGVEVRRLNQNYYDGDDAEGLEEQAIPLEQSFKRALSSFDARFDGHSYWVGIVYQRPIRGGGKSAAADITKALESFLGGARATPSMLQANKNIQLEIRDSRLAPGRLFRRSISLDVDFGGSDVEVYSENIAHCIEEKAQKIIPVKNRYSEWWLLLVDTIMFWDFEPSEVDEVRSGIASFGGFDRVTVIDYLGDRCLVELAP
jgi:hypothetical protein